jgi:hypothetical protein
MVFIGVRAYGICLIHMICLSVAEPVIRRVPGVRLDELGFLTGPLAWPASLLKLALGFGTALAGASVLAIVLERPFIELGRFAGSDPVAPPPLEHELSAAAGGKDVLPAALKAFGSRPGPPDRCKIVIQI